MTAGLAAVVGCHGDGTAHPGATFSDSAGTTIVANRPPGTLAPLRIDETLRLGVIDGDGPEQFSQVSDVALGVDGSIVVGDNGSGTARVFDPTGTFVRRLGGRGQGPGEIGRLQAIGVFGDTVLITDGTRGGKVVLYSTDGTLLESLRVTRDDGRRVAPVRPSSRGWVLNVSDRGSMPELQAGESEVQYTDSHWGAFGSESVGPIVYHVPISMLFGTGAGGSGAIDRSLFHTTVLRGFDAEGRLFQTHDQAYRIDIFDGPRLVTSVRRAYESRALGPDDVAALKTAVLMTIDTSSAFGNASREEARQARAARMDRRAALPLPDVMSPFGDLLVSPDGSFWVEVLRSETLIERELDSMFNLVGGFPSGQTDWDLYSREGHLLGSVTLPARFRAEAVNGLTVIGVWADELDVEFVVRFEVTHDGRRESR